MNDKRKLKLKKFYFHPITSFLILTILVVILSGIFSIFEMQATYNTVNINTKELEPTLITVENLFSFSGFRYMFSNAIKQFLSFAPLGTLLISIIAISVAETTGLIETITKKYLSKISRYIFTFIIIFEAVQAFRISEFHYLE